MFRFKILHQSRTSRARLGEIATPHGKILTPAFVPVATQASIKSLTPREIREIGVQVFFANTYHLHLRPGEDVIENLGGLHKFMAWEGPIVTDSGGFQVFSLGFGRQHGVGKIANIFPDEIGVSMKPSQAGSPVGQKPNLVKIDNDGVTFTSHLDGATLRLTPQKSIQIQEKLGADIVLAFDECTSPLNSYEYTKKAMQRTHGWAQICLQVKARKDQALFGIIQGGEWQDLREESVQFIGNLPFAGFAIGGSLGESKADMHKVLDWTIPVLPEDKPRHLLGIGEVEDIFAGVKRGVDSFDCVAPTRLARNGTALVKVKGQGVAAPSYGAHSPVDFRINLINAQFKKNPNPIDKNCHCYCCQNFSRAYLNHLFRSHEMLGPHLLTLHNLTFMENLMSQIREAIKDENLDELEKEYFLIFAT